MKAKEDASVARAAVKSGSENENMEEDGEIGDEEPVGENSSVENHSMLIRLGGIFTRSRRILSTTNFPMLLDRFFFTNIHQMGQLNLI